MAKALYDGVNGIARKVKKKYDGVNGIARKVKKAYDGVNGIARQYWSSAPPIGELPVGTSVYMNVSGVRKEFLIVHQGLPSSIYDSSCNGTWLLMKNIHTKKVGGSTNHYYQNSSIHTYLNDTFYPLFDANIKPLIKQVKIPYYSAKNTVSSGANGFAVRVFILSAIEIGAYGTWSGGYAVTQDGARLEYFPQVHTNIVQSHLVTKYNGTNTLWATRSPVSSGDSSSVAHVDERGRLMSSYISNTFGVRPALILPSDTGYNESFDIIT